MELPRMSDIMGMKIGATFFKTIENIEISKPNEYTPIIKLYLIFSFIFAEGAI